MCATLAHAARLASAGCCVVFAAAAPAADGDLDLTFGSAGQVMTDFGHSTDIANAVMAQLLCLESMDPDRDIQIYINSPGGSFTALTAIYDTMRFVKPDIQTVCLGQAASAAAILLAAGAPGKRLALPNSRILIHQPYTEGTYGQSSDIEIQANEILRMRELLEQMIAEHSGKTVEEVSRDIERDKILTAEGAVEYGLIDAVLESLKTPALA